MKSTSFLLFTCIGISFLSSIVYSIDYRVVEHQDDFLINCCKPLDFSQPRNIHYFLRNIFSNKRYAQEYLPYNISSHLVQFLEHGGKAAKQKALYMESTLRLFYNELKRTIFTCNKSFSEMLDTVPAIIKTACGRSENSFFSTIENNMMGIFVPTFLSQFSFFKSNPEEFLKKLSHDITSMIENSFNVQDHVAQEQLKQMFVRFLEMGLMKIVWNQADQPQAWESVKKISIQLADVMEMGLITPDELDDLYKSLLESYCRFLDLSGSDLSKSLIATIKNEVRSCDLLLFELEEQEEFIETKRERMLDVLVETEAKVEARMHGIITDIVVY
jgi:hypothetical protein